MNVGLSIWDRLTHVVLFLLVVAAVAGVIVWYQPVIRANEQMRQDILVKQKEIEQQKEISRRLEAQIRAMQDPRTIERLAREKLSFAKPGESIVHFDPVTTNGLEK